MVTFLSGKSGRCISVSRRSLFPRKHRFDNVLSAFNHREGIALSTITYNDDGNVRPVLYRLSLAEMVVPYGAPEHPHPRKHAFDVYAFLVAYCYLAFVS